MQDVFACTFSEQNLQECLARDPNLLPLLQSLNQIDQEIVKVAPERPLAQINKVDLAILRIIVFEAQSTKTPHKVLIDEAIELAKAFGSETSPKFINAALAKLLLFEDGKME
jgi:transcription termination factor NusB